MLKKLLFMLITAFVLSIIQKVSATDINSMKFKKEAVGACIIAMEKVYEKNAEISMDGIIALCNCQVASMIEMLNNKSKYKAYSDSELFEKSHKECTYLLLEGKREKDRLETIPDNIEAYKILSDEMNISMPFRIDNDTIMTTSFATRSGITLMIKMDNSKSSIPYAQLKKRFRSVRLKAKKASMRAVCTDDATLTVWELLPKMNFTYRISDEKGQFLDSYSISYTDCKLYTE